MSFSIFQFHLLLLLLLLLSTNQLAFSSTTSSPQRVSIDVDSILPQSLRVAISEAVKVLSLLEINGISITENHKGSIQDCHELHQITLATLNKSLVRLTTTRNLADVNAFLAAAITNKNTCLEGLQSASGPLKPLLVATIITAYKQVSNCLALLSNKGMMMAKGDGDDYEYNTNLITVASDGSGNFTTITDTY